MKKEYYVDEGLLENWRGNLSKVFSDLKTSEGTRDTINYIMGSIDSILAGGNYREE